MSFWKRLFGGTPPVDLPPPREKLVPANDGADAVLEDMRDRVRLDVASGFYSHEELIQHAVDYVSDEMAEAELRPIASRMVEEALTAHAQSQRNWPATTDCDRLDAAFADLEAGGIVMRHNFTCCGTCGSTEIWDEVGAFETGGARACGYGFYHMQDTESAVDGGGLFLNYGACEEGEEPALATGRAIVDALERHGLRTDWDGSWDRRIAVSLDWKRRAVA